MLASDINILLCLWTASLTVHGDEPPFRNHQHLYDTIDSMEVSDIPWESLMLNYMGIRLDDEVPSWMDEVWFHDPWQLVCNLISNPDFKNEFDYVPYHEYDSHNFTNHCFHNFMSGDWAWKQAVYHFMFILSRSNISQIG